MHMHTHIHRGCTESAGTFMCGFVKDDDAELGIKTVSLFVCFL